MKHFAKKNLLDIVVIVLGAVVSGCSLLLADMPSFFISVCITALSEISVFQIRHSVNAKMEDLIHFTDDYARFEKELSSAYFKKETFINIFSHIESDNQQRVLDAIKTEYGTYSQTLDYIGRGYYPIRPHDKRDRSLYLIQKNIITNTENEICATHHVDSNDNLNLWDVSRNGYNYPSFNEHIFLPIKAKSQSISEYVGRRLFIVPANGYSSLNSSVEIWRRVISTQMELKFHCRYLTKEREAEVLRETNSISSGHSDDLLIGDGKYCFIFRQDSSWSISAFETISLSAASECKSVFEVLWENASPLSEADGNYSFFRDLASKESQ